MEVDPCLATFLVDPLVVGPCLVAYLEEAASCLVACLVAYLAAYLAACLLVVDNQVVPLVACPLVVAYLVAFLGVVASYLAASFLEVVVVAFLAASFLVVVVVAFLVAYQELDSQELAKQSCAGSL